MYLAPVFARSATEQALFYVVFDRFVAKITEPDPNVELVDAPTEIEPEPEQGRKGLDYILWGLLLLFALLKGWEACQPWKPVPVAAFRPSFRLQKWVNGKGEDQVFVGSKGEKWILENFGTFGDGDTLLVVNKSKYFNTTDSLNYHFRVNLLVEGDTTQGKILSPAPDGSNSWLTILKATPGNGQASIMVYGSNTANTWKDTLNLPIALKCAHLPDLPAFKVPKSIPQGGTLQCSAIGKQGKGTVYTWLIDGGDPIHRATASKKIDQAGQISVQFSINDTLAAGACAHDTSFMVQVGDE
ncbi:MAG: hypothetical protein KGS48_16205, partial [Bacteroidetes bacterium]|nr:hypothetical protein [Bacteroidota bacterium]